MGLKIGKLGRWLYSGVVVLLISGCTTAVAVQQLEQFDAEAVERDVVLRTGQKIDGSPSPSPVYTPGEVVQLQLNALQNNNNVDDGIEIVFRFASPLNKRNTGPLRRFESILKSPSYRPMLGHQSALLDAPLISGRDALQRVRLIDKRGQEIVYLFIMSQQLGDNCNGCWMTDIVIIESITPVEPI